MGDRVVLRKRKGAFWQGSRGNRPTSPRARRGVRWGQRAGSLRGSGLGSVAGVGEGGAARYTRGHRGVSVRSLNQPAARARAPEPSLADRRYVLKREGIPDAGCCFGSLRGCGLGVQNGLHLVEARWLPASASAAGVSGTLSPPD